MGWTFWLATGPERTRTVAERWPAVCRAALQLASPRWWAGLAGGIIGQACAVPAGWPFAVGALVLWCAAIVRSRPGWPAAQVLAIGAVAWSVTGMGWVMAAVRPDSELRMLWQLVALGVVASHHALCLLCGWWAAGLLTRSSASPKINAWRWCCALTAGECLQQLGWFGHGYASLAVALVDLPGAAVVLPWLGSMGWALVISGFSAGLALLLTRASSSGAAPWRPTWAGGALGSIGLLCMGAAWWSTQAVEPQADAKPLPVLILQARQQQLTEWTPAERDASVLQLQRAMTEVPQGGVVVTPETFFAGVPPSEVAGQWADLMNLASQRGVSALVGMPNVFRDERGVHGMNSVTQLAPGRVSVYGKERLVPFAEYLPWPDLLGFFYRHVFESAREHPLPAPAEWQRPLYVQGQSVGVVICHELSFSGTVAERARPASWLVSLSDDGWVGRPGYLAQMLGIARVRAMETRKPLLRVAVGGPSYLIDPEGRVLASTLPGHPPTQLVWVAPQPQTSVFVTHAAALPWLYLLALLCPVRALTARPGRQRHPPSQETRT